MSVSGVGPQQRVWATSRALNVSQTWRGLRRGGGDPTWIGRGEVLLRGIRTPVGPVALQVQPRRDRGDIAAVAWGSAEATTWLLDRLPVMLGESDDDSGFRPDHPVLIAARRAHPGLRVPRTGLVMESLIPAIIEQKVTGQEAFSGFRRLVRRTGSVAPGPLGQLGLMVPASVERLRAVPSWEWLQWGISPQRSDTLMRALRVADRLSEVVDLPAEQARRRLRAVPGIGGWTAAEVSQRALGDADAVSFGDYHVARNVGYALTGQIADDRQLQELLRPYQGHRFRVQALIAAQRIMVPRRGPRMAPRAHLPVRPGSR